MKKQFLLLLLLLYSYFLLAQKNNPPVDEKNIKAASNYFAQVATAQEDMNRKYMVFMSIAAHKKKERKINRAKQNTLESMTKCRHKLLAMPDFSGDDSLRKAAAKYVQVCIDVFNQDYDHLVDLEEIAEQSIDKMEAYVNLRKQVNAKTSQIAINYNNAQIYFAKKFGLQLVEESSDVGKKLMKAAHLNQYLSDIHLIFFKCSWQEQQLVKAVNNRKIAEIEQARLALLKYSQEGLASLSSDTLKNFDKDPSLTNAGKKLLNFYVKLADADIPKMVSLWLDDENQQKIKDAITNNGSNYKTKEDMKVFDMATKKIESNKRALDLLIEKLNSKNRDNMENWSIIEEDFEDRHMPYLKK